MQPTLHHSYVTGVSCAVASIGLSPHFGSHHNNSNIHTKIHTTAAIARKPLPRFEIARAISLQTVIRFFEPLQHLHMLSSRKAAGFANLQHHPGSKLQQSSTLDHRLSEIPQLVPATSSKLPSSTSSSTDPLQQLRCNPGKLEICFSNQQAPQQAKLVNTVSSQSSRTSLLGFPARLGPRVLEILRAKKFFEASSDTF